MFEVSSTDPPLKIEYKHLYSLLRCISTCKLRNEETHNKEILLSIGGDFRTFKTDVSKMMRQSSMIYDLIGVFNKQGDSASKKIRCQAVQEPPSVLFV